KGSDAQIRRYLALALGRLQDARAVPALQKATDDEDSQTVIWSIWALGKIGDKSSTPFVLSKLESTDSSIRVMSAYILGVLEDPKAIPPLQGHLDDSSVEVTWNSALALARMHDGSGKALLEKMMDRDYLAGFPRMDEEKKKDLIINTIAASTKLADPALNEQIKRLSSSDPSPTVRNAALKALQ
ncbi:MAG TPA: HEAT repeat domain-containing protein, partial [Acidobacteriota bacterium]|nr:HEAT repeat domain-containing protein [Acidobacteriota bacterium]